MSERSSETQTCRRSGRSADRSGGWAHEGANGSDGPTFFAAALVHELGLRSGRSGDRQESVVPNDKTAVERQPAIHAIAAQDARHVVSRLWVGPAPTDRGRLGLGGALGRGEDRFVEQTEHACYAALCAWT